MTRDSPAAPNGTGVPTGEAAERNLEPILDALMPVLPASGVVLELASGSGVHIAALAAHRADLSFHPTDPDPVRRAATDARCASLPNVAPAQALDACAPGWGEAVAVDVVLLVNLLHLISEAQMAVLLDEVSQAVRPGGVFALYGPFFRETAPASLGDLAFNADLQARDSSIGYKHLEAVASVLGVLDFQVSSKEMPANNVLLLARKARTPGL